MDVCVHTGQFNGEGEESCKEYENECFSLGVSRGVDCTRAVPGVKLKSDQWFISSSLYYYYVQVEGEQESAGQELNTGISNQTTTVSHMALGATEQATVIKVGMNTDAWHHQRLPPQMKCFSYFQFSPAAGIHQLEFDKWDKLEE